MRVGLWGHLAVRDACLLDMCYSKSSLILVEIYLNSSRHVWFSIAGKILAVPCVDTGCLFNYDNKHSVS